MLVHLGVCLRDHLLQDVDESLISPDADNVGGAIAVDVCPGIEHVPLCPNLIKACDMGETLDISTLEVGCDDLLDIPMLWAVMGRGLLVRLASIDEENRSSTLPNLKMSAAEDVRRR